MRKLDAAVILLTIAFVVSMVLPESWAGFLHVGAVPLGAFVFALLCFALTTQLLRKPAAVSHGLMGGLAAVTIITANGFLRGNVETFALKFFVADLFCFFALLAGYALARTLSWEHITQLLSRLTLALSFIIIATYVALIMGVVTSLFDIPGRTVTLSIFNAVGFLIVLLPWVTVSPHWGKTKDGLRNYLLFTTAVLTGLLSATRSLIIVIIVAACLYLVLKKKHFSTGFFLRSVFGASLLLLLLFSGFPLLSTFGLDRLSETLIGEESRFEELNLMWSQISNDLVAGQGIGSRFVSNVIADESPLASAPHIGIATFLMKGGVLMFLGYAVAPLAIAIFVLSSAARPERQRGAAASVIMFIAMSCLSGGYSPLPMFAYGFAMSFMIAREPARAMARFGNMQWARGIQPLQSRIS